MSKPFRVMIAALLWMILYIPGFQAQNKLLTSFPPNGLEPVKKTDTDLLYNAWEMGAMERENNRAIREGSPMMDLLFEIAEQNYYTSISKQSPSVGIDIHFIEETLKPDELLLEYCISETSLYIFSISHDTCFLFRRGLELPLWSTLDRYRKQLRTAEMEGLSQLCQQMYSLLILPVRKFLDGKRRLIIIPGKDLSGLPFEAFIMTDDFHPGTSFNNRRFLVYDYEITYHYSAMQWANQQYSRLNPGVNGSNRENKFDFIGFSPFFSTNSNVNPLPESGKEIALIGDLFRKKELSSWLVYERASRKDDFKEMAGTSKILHLATHFSPGIDSSDGGGFLFWDYNPCHKHEEPGKGVLSMQEICEMRLENDLIVLNACASGSPQKCTSGRMASLALSFMMAGGRNILSTLWNIPDTHAFTFIVDFYRQWLSGKTFSQALRAVKIKMIQRKETSLPTLWAAYILMGE